MLVGLAFVAVAIGTFAQVHGMFSTGAGAMLLIYALALMAIGFVAWRGLMMMSGLVIGAALLHVPATVELAMHGAPWLWATLPVFIATAVLGVRARVLHQRAEVSARS